jgi:hypothetical protein
MILTMFWGPSDHAIWNCLNAIWTRYLDSFENYLEVMSETFSKLPKHFTCSHFGTKRRWYVAGTKLIPVGHWYTLSFFWVFSKYLSNLNQWIYIKDEETQWSFIFKVHTLLTNRMTSEIEPASMLKNPNGLHLWNVEFVRAIWSCSL